MRKLWSKIATGQPAISRERGVEGQPRAAAQRGYPNTEDAEDPMMAPPDYEVRQCGRVLELQNRDLWLRPTDMSWHLPILFTIREEPFKNYRSRTPEMWKAKGTRSRTSRRRRRPRKGKMNGMMPNGSHHLGHGNNQWLGLRLHLHLGNSGARTKRANVLIGNRQPIGSARTNCASVLSGNHQLIGTAQTTRVSGIPDSRRSNGSEE